MADRFSQGVLALAGSAALALPCVSLAADVEPSATSLDTFLSSARDLLQDGTSRLESMLRDRFQAVSSDKPDWFREQSPLDFDDDAAPADEALQLVVQQDRRDGTDLLTLRYPIGDVGDLKTYAGAGINQAQYYAAVDDLGLPAVLSRRNRHRSMGGAVEFGAELRLSEQLRFNADVRWVDLASDASMLRAADGLVGADPVSIGVSLGWRFR